MHNLVHAGWGWALLGCSEKPCALFLGVLASNLLRIPCQRLGTSVIAAPSRRSTMQQRCAQACVHVLQLLPPSAVLHWSGASEQRLDAERWALRCGLGPRPMTAVNTAISSAAVTGNGALRGCRWHAASPPIWNSYARPSLLHSRSYRNAPNHQYHHASAWPSTQVAPYSPCEVTARLCLIFSSEASLNCWMSVRHYLIKTLTSPLHLLSPWMMKMAPRLGWMGDLSLLNFSRPDRLTNPSQSPLN